VTSPVVLPSAAPPPIQPLSLANIQWQVLNKTSIEQLLAKPKSSSSQSFIFYSLTANNFTALYSNLLELQRYIEDQKQVILFYEQVENNKLNAVTKNKRR
jgi:hypothetical protein